MTLNRFVAGLRTIRDKMAEFSKNPERTASYHTRNFQVYFGNGVDPVPGVSKVSGLRRCTEPVSDYEGEDSLGPHFSPGETTFKPIRLERGVTHDNTFEQWANKVHNITGDPGKTTSLKDYKKNIRISLLNEAGQQVLAYNVFNCWPIEYVAIDEFNAACSETATESLTLQNEGWQRDYDVMEPEQPAYTQPAE